MLHKYSAYAGGTWGVVSSVSLSVRERDVFKGGVRHGILKTSEDIIFTPVSRWMCSLAFANTCLYGEHNLAYQEYLGVYG